MADGADMPALVQRPIGLGAILDNVETVLLGEVHQRVHIGGVAGEVNRDYGLGSFGDSALDIFGVEAKVVTTQIGEDGDGVLREDGDDGADVSDGSGDDFVARVGVHCSDGDVYRGSAGGGGGAVLHAEMVGELLFDFGDELAGGAVHHAGFDDLPEVAELLLADGAAGGTAHGRIGLVTANGLSSIDGQYGHAIASSVFFSPPRCGR